jgi:Na+/glutamate symporter
MHIGRIHPLLDEKRQALARRYEKENRLLGLAGSALSLVLLVAFYETGLSARLTHLWSGGSLVWPFLAYTAGFLAWLTILSLPLNFYRGYVHEHR